MRGGGGTSRGGCLVIGHRRRCSPELAPRVWAGLRSNAGRDQLERAEAGLADRFLPMEGLLSIGV